MEQNDTARMAALLQQIRDNQATQLERQAEALALQKEQLDLMRVQFERAARLQDRAEELQTRGMGIMTTARRSLAVVLPIVILLIIYLSWLLFR
ncbi:MAG: hypothetical protein EXR87_03050 [Gammaproteobacteria bacterium]|nr:hypothetical protein [Gammaproteobacteria bacterium]